MSNVTPTDPPAEPDWKAEAEKWKALSRKNEETAKANAEKARRVDSLEADYARLSDELTTVKQSSETLGRENLRLSVGLDKGLPKALIERLRGDDEETLAADADALIQLIPQPPAAGTTSPKPDPSQGARGAGKQTAAEQFAAAVGDLFTT